MRYTILIDADFERRKRVLRHLAQIDLSEAVDAVKSGGVIAFPTDTFYALGVDAMNELAIRKAFEIKRRPATTPMPVLISEIFASRNVHLGASTPRLVRSQSGFGRVR